MKDSRSQEYIRKTAILQVFYYQSNVVSSVHGMSTPTYLSDGAILGAILSVT